MQEKKTPPPYFPLYAKDFLADQYVQIMDAAEVGGYILLLCSAWETSDCMLPDNDKALSRLSRLGEQWFSGSGEVIRQCFKNRNGKLYNPRLLAEREKKVGWLKKCSEAGKKSGKVRQDQALRSGRKVLKISNN